MNRQLNYTDRFTPALCDFVAQEDDSLVTTCEVTQDELKRYLQERLRLHSSAIDWRSSRIGTEVLRLRMRRGGNLIITLKEFPPKEQVPGIFLDEQAVISFYTAAGASWPEQHRLLEQVFDTDSRLRCGYGRSLLALARHMTVTRSCCVDSENMVCMIDRLVYTLRSAYLRLSVGQGAFLPPRESFAATSRVFKALLELPLTIEDRLWIEKGLKVLAAAAAEYDLAVSFCPLQNPQRRRARVRELPDFDRALQRPLSETSCERPELDVKEAVRLAGRLGIKGVHSIKYSAAAFGLYGYLEIYFGRCGKLIIQLDGSLAVHVVFDSRRSFKTYLQDAQIDQQTLVALKRYYHRPQNRTLLKLYDRNLSSILKAFSDLLQGTLNSSQQRAVRRSLNLLAGARRTLLAGLVPNLLVVYQRLSDNIEQIQDYHQGLSAVERRLLSFLYDRIMIEGVEMCLAIPVLSCHR